jgi:hypothetical protein
MQALRCTRAATSVLTTTVFGLQLLALGACGRSGSEGVDGGVARGGPPAQEGEVEGGGDRTAVAVGLKVGDVAPVFSLEGSDGRTYGLVDYRGRQTVVLAWFAKAFSEA